MPYYGSDFEGDTKGFPREVRWSYLAALWHYWSVTKTAGLPTEDAQLRQICDCPSADWCRTKAFIFSGQPYFALVDGKWHQSRARGLFEEATSSYERRVAASKVAVAARHKPSNEHPNESSNEPLHESSNETLTKPEPQPQCLTNVRQLVASLPQQSDGEWLEGLKSNTAYEGIDVGREYGKMCAWCETNGKKPSRRRFVNWLNRAERPMERQKPQATVYGLKTIIEAKQKEADALKNRFCSEGPLSNEWSDVTSMVNYKKLRGEIAALNKQLAAMA
jgi:uncharacterized protein YdaU (DUF1376 family)